MCNHTFLNIDSYKETKDRNIAVEEEFRDNKAEQQIFERGQSKRIWGELYKVHFYSISKIQNILQKSFFVWFYIHLLSNTFSCCY